MATTNGELQYFVGRETELQALRDFVADPSPGVLLVTGPPGIGKSFLLRKFVEELKKRAPAKKAPQDYLKATMKGQLPIALGKPIVVHHRLRRGLGAEEFGHIGLAIAKQDHRIWGEHEPRNFKRSLLRLAEKFNPGGVLPVGPALVELLKGGPTDICDALYANDWPSYFVRVAVHACKAMLDDERLVVVIDAEKTFENEPVRHALSRIAGIVPKKAKLILCLREADPLLYDTEFLSYPNVKAPPNLPLAPVRLLPEDLAVESLAARLNLASDSELVKQVIARIGGLGILIPTVATLVNDAGLSLEQLLERLPSGCEPFTAMLVLAGEALKVDAPVPDVLRSLAVAREPLSVPELQVALAILGDDLDTDSLTRAISVPVVRNQLSVEHDERLWRYSPYHDWVREAICQVTLQDKDKDSLGEYHQALGEFYWARLEDNEDDERAIRHCTYHLAQGDLADAQAKQRFLAAVVETADQKGTWGLTRDLEQELKLACELVDGHTLKVDPVSRAIIWNESGMLAMATGDLPAALAHFECVRALAPEIERLSDGHGKQSLAAALGNIGLVYRHMGLLEEALQAHQHALEIDRAIGHRRGEANDLANIGLVYKQMGRLEEALQSAQEALEISQEIGYRRGEATALGSISNVQSQMGRLKEALQAQQDALKIFKEIRYRLGEATALGNIGPVYKQMGRRKEALQAYQDALKKHREIGHRQGEAAALANIGLIHEDKGEPREALDYLRQALAISKGIGAVHHIEQAKRDIVRLEEKLSGSES